MNLQENFRRGFGEAVLHQWEQPKPSSVVWLLPRALPPQCPQLPTAVHLGTTLGHVPRVPAWLRSPPPCMSMRDGGVKDRPAQRGWWDGTYLEHTKYIFG